MVSKSDPDRACTKRGMTLKPAKHEDAAQRAKSECL